MIALFFIPKMSIKDSNQNFYPILDRIRSPREISRCLDIYVGPFEQFDVLDWFWIIFCTYSEIDLSPKFLSLLFDVRSIL